MGCLHIQHVNKICKFAVNIGYLQLFVFYSLCPQWQNTIQSIKAKKRKKTEILSVVIDSFKLTENSRRAPFPCLRVAVYWLISDDDRKSFILIFFILRIQSSFTIRGQSLMRLFLQMEERGGASPNSQLAANSSPILFTRIQKLAEEIWQHPVHMKSARKRTTNIVWWNNRLMKWSPVEGIGATE